MEADRQRMEAERQIMEQMFQWMQSLGEKMGQSSPPMLFPAPPPATTHVSMNDLVLCSYLKSCLTHAISSPLYRINRRDRMMGLMT